MGTAVELYGRPWSEPEFIIVLDAYLKQKGPTDEHAELVTSLANLLGRTPASVAMRFENYAALDPTQSHRAGLSRGGPRCRKYFDQWSQDPSALHKCAEVLIRDKRSIPLPGLFEPDPVKLPAGFSGRYELYDAIGEGTFSTVLSCIERDSGKRYAIKILKPDLRVDKEAFGRFRREIRILREVKHPRIIQIHEDNLDQIEDVPAFIMDLAECSLRSFLEYQQGSGSQLFRSHRPILSATEASNVIRDVLEALATMHNAGNNLVHRDINPNNILRKSDGRWSVGDFGLAKFLSRPPATASYKTEVAQGGAWGTEPYAAPEQWRDFVNVDHRVDIFAVGVLIWDILGTEFPPMDRGATGLSPALEKVFLKAVQRSRDDRFQSVDELSAAFLDALQN